MLTRARDAAFANVVLNHQVIYPWLCGSKTEPLDVSDVCADPQHVVLTGEHGVAIFVKLDIGLYEMHTAVLPEGRGRWALEAGREALEYMFCRTDAVEILTKCPHGNLAAKAGARMLGMTHDFTTRPLWRYGKRVVPIDVYALRIQEWIGRADRMIVEGHSVHRLLLENGVEVDHGDDADHERYVGATWMMLRNGQIAKGVHFYYRWAVMAGYRPITVIGENPVRLNIGKAIARFDGDAWEIIRPQPMTAA